MNMRRLNPALARAGTAIIVASMPVLASSSSLADPPVFEDNYEQYDATGGAQLLTTQSDYISDAPQILHVVSLNAIDGQSVRHVGDSTEIREFDLFSPIFLPTHGKLQCSLRITAYPYTIYQIATFDTHSDVVNVRVRFMNNEITIFHGEEPSRRLTETPIGATIVPGEDFLICIEVTNAGELFVYLDDELIFEGLENNFAQFGVPGRIGQWGIWASTRVDGFVDGTGDTLTIDNVEINAAPCQQDLSADGVITALDIASLLSEWGACIDRLEPCPADFNNDGLVSAEDLSILLSEWGECD